MDKVKPSDFDLSGGFRNSPLTRDKQEAVARNIVKFSVQNGNRWFSFSAWTYERLCAGMVGGFTIETQRSTLQHMATRESGILDWDGELYMVNENFFRVLATFIS
ncbi:MAG: hypothetical protein WC387_01100 [Candidatus Paceibacterota bacterium]